MSHRTTRISFWSNFVHYLLLLTQFVEVDFAQYISPNTDFSNDNIIIVGRKSKKQQRQFIMKNTVVKIFLPNIQNIVIVYKFDQNLARCFAYIVQEKQVRAWQMIKLDQNFYISLFQFKHCSFNHYHTNIEYKE